MENLQIIQMLLVKLAMHYQYTPTAEQLESNAKALADIPLDQLIAAIEQVKRDPKITRFPVSAVIRNKIDPYDNSEAVSDLIHKTVYRVGRDNFERAKELLGGDRSIAWLTVQRIGGWYAVHQLFAEESSHGTLKAQLRESARSYAEQARAGTLDNIPQIPKSGRELVSLQGIMAKLQISAPTTPEPTP